MIADDVMINFDFLANEANGLDNITISTCFWHSLHLTSLLLSILTIP